MIGLFDNTSFTFFVLRARSLTYAYYLNNIIAIRQWQKIVKRVETLEFAGHIRAARGFILFVLSE